MKRISRKMLVAVCAAALAFGVTATAQVYKYYSPGTVWTVTTIKMKSGMDQAYLAYLDGQFKKESDAR